MPSLKLALIHSTADHKQPERNRAHLLELFQRAGDAGAQMAIAPELAVSGYSFTSRQDIAPYTESADGPTLSALADLTRSYGLYACIGLAEHDPRSAILYNSAFVLGPSGALVCRYRKINAEYRWACPGNPREDNTFATPWGRMGVLICSDSYHSLLPRITALRGADLVLIPANWPPTGLDPREIWRTRALENGVYVAACNRTGRDLTMDCRQGPSAVFAPCGTTLLDRSSPESQLLLVDLPLNDQQRLDPVTRQQRLQSRQGMEIGDCYLNLVGIADLTAFLRLPPPGPLPLCCPVAPSVEQALAALETLLSAATEATLIVLPAGRYDDVALDRIAALCVRSGSTVILTRTGPEAGPCWCSGGQGVETRTWTAQGSAVSALPIVDCTAARVLLAPMAVLRHPEPVLAGAKQGCDLAVASETFLSDEDRLIAGARTIDNVAVAVCARNRAGVWMTPEGHQRWEEQLAEPGQQCRYLLDTTRTRKKRFQDRVDFDCLLAGPHPLQGKR
jgi:predicted amidohydrolase